MAKMSLYPASPPDVPADLAEPSSQYRIQTFLMLFGLVLFFLLYFGLMFSCVLYALCASFLFFVTNVPAIFKLVAILLIVPAMILFIYLLKNLFKVERARKEFRIEIFEDEHPRLFDFIAQVCEETGTPIPEHVYVDYLVNAAAILETTSFFHLFLPSRRSLLIGLGLVNVINLTEFKALLAHEFGHCSQKTMKIGFFVFTMRAIVTHMVAGDDWFDRFIAAWSKRRARIAWPAHVCRGVLWVPRKLVLNMWYVVSFVDGALSRQEEFNADLVAVSLTGSDAPIHLLHRGNIGQASFHQAECDLRVAMDHHLYTNDLFYHQSAAVGFLRRNSKDASFEEPPALPDHPGETTQVFQEDADEAAEVWSTHPSCYEREQYAKAQYIRTEFDERSPWLLFDNVKGLRERVTYKFYRFFFKIPKDVILADPQEVQEFIDEEHADCEYDPKYQGLYDNRNLLIENIHELAKEVSKRPWTFPELKHAHATLYNVEIKNRAQLHSKRVEKKSLLRAVKNGWHPSKGAEFEFRGEIDDLENAERLHEEIAKEDRWLIEHDRRVFLTYFQMGLDLHQEVADDLYRRYEFHLDVQNIWHALQKQQPAIESAIYFLNSPASNDVALHESEELLTIFRDTHKTMSDMLTAATGLTLPALRNLPMGQPLRLFLLNKNLIESLSLPGVKLDRQWIGDLLNQFREMKTKVDRIHVKSLAGILSLQERIGNECQRRWSALPAVNASAK